MALVIDSKKNRVYLQCKRGISTADGRDMEHRRTLLLIDEAHDDRRLLAIRLEGLGYKVLEAENLSQVQSVLKHEVVDQVVSEWAFAGLEDDSLVQILEPALRSVFLFTDQPISNLPLFLNRTGIKAVVSKKKRSELLQLLSQNRNPSLSMASKRAALFGRHLLLVEDSPTVRHFIRRAIEAQHPDWLLTEAANAEQALAEIAHKPFDLIVLDLEIPGTDGQILLRYLLEKPQVKYKPVLALAPCSQRGLRESYKNHPYVVFLPKPVMATQVLESIHSILGGKKVLAGV
jgi:CheY-like chemotaxis protein